MTTSIVHDQPAQGNDTRTLPAVTISEHAQGFLRQKYGPGTYFYAIFGPGEKLLHPESPDQRGYSVMRETTEEDARGILCLCVGSEGEGIISFTDTPAGRIVGEEVATIFIVEERPPAPVTYTLTVTEGNALPSEGIHPAATGKEARVIYTANIAPIPGRLHITDRPGHDSLMIERLTAEQIGAMHSDPESGMIMGVVDSYNVEL